MSFYIIARNLRTGYAGFFSSAQISFELKEGSALCLLGGSGCGKTTLLKTLAGMLPKISGELEFKGRTPSSAYVWQENALFPWMRVKDQICLPLKLKKGKNIEEQCRFLMHELELDGLDKRFVHELSGGQRQRLCLARALIASPGLLFLDEPFSAIDAVLKERLQDLLKKLLYERHCTLITVTHDLSEAVYLGKQILILGPLGSKEFFLFDNPLYSVDPDPLIREKAEFSLIVSTLHQKLRLMHNGFA